MSESVHRVSWIAAAFTVVAAGCATTLEPRPGKITLESALASIGKGLVEMKKAQIEANNKQEFVTGLVPSEAEVTFNIHAAGEQNGKLYVELSPIPASGGVTGKAGADLGTAYSASRGNQITLKFRSIVFSNTTTTKDAVIVEGPTDPKMLEAIVAALKKAGVIHYMPP